MLSLSLNEMVVLESWSQQIWDLIQFFATNSSDVVWIFQYLRVEFV